MKLNIDFSALDKLLNDMGVKPKETPIVFMPANMEDLGTTGVEIKITDVTRSPNELLTLNGVQILLYLKEVKKYQNSFKLQKFHLYYCQTLNRMDKEGSFDKYVATTRKDGGFLVDVPSEKKYNLDQELDVCKNCLSLYNQQDENKQNQKNYTVKTFSIAEFFECVGYSSFPKETTYTDISAPKSGYPENWNEISDTRKKECNYVCQECDLDLKNDKKLLQTHHVDRKPEKKDHSPNNLKVLCIECHSDQPSHGHMKSSHADQILEIQKIRQSR